MTQVKINKVFGETPVNVILHKNDDGKVAKMEVNNRKFSSERMGRAFMESELKLTSEQVNEVMNEGGEIIEAVATETGTQAKKETSAKTPKAPKEPKAAVKFKQSFRTGKTAIEIEIEEKMESNKKVVNGHIMDILTGEVKRFNSKDQAIELLLAGYLVSKVTALKMLKADCPIALTEDALKAITPGVELDDVGIIGKAAPTPKTPKEPRKPVDGYPKWVLRDPQDVNQYKLVQEAKASGYSAKIMEANRATRGQVNVLFGKDMLWHVSVTTVEDFVKSEEYKPLAERISTLTAGDRAKNESLESTEKRYAIFLARALAGTYKLAFDEKVDVQKIETEDLLTKERRKSVYNR
jgi:hypothetical protein